MKRYETLSKEEIIDVFMGTNSPTCENCKVDEGYCFNPDLSCLDIAHNYLYDEVPDVIHAYRWETIESTKELKELFRNWYEAYYNDMYTSEKFGAYLRQPVEVFEKAEILLTDEILCTSRMEHLPKEQIIAIFKNSDKSCNDCIVNRHHKYDKTYDCEYFKYCDEVSPEKTCNELIEEYLTEEVEYVPRWITIADNNDIVAMEVLYHAKYPDGDEYFTFLDYLCEYVEFEDNSTSC